MAEVRTLSAEALEGLGITVVDIADAIERIFVARAAGTAWGTPKSVILPPDGRLLMTMMAASEAPPVMAVKSLVMNARNPERGLPQINAQVLLTDSQTGLPLAIIDGNWITEIRTAALSLVAARRMARPEARSVAFVGTGVQARSHLRAFASEFPLAAVRMVGRGRANLDRLSALADALSLEAIECGAEEALREADIVVTSISYTPDTVPFIDAAWIAPGAFVAVTDTFVPWKRETLGVFDRVIIDDRAQEQAMTKRPLVPLETVAGDLGELLEGHIPGRVSNEERALFAFRGLALADLAAATLVYQRDVAV